MARFTTTPSTTVPTQAAPSQPTPTFRRSVPTTTPPGVRANRYPGTCVTCGQRVEAEVGRLDKESDRWVTTHIVCPEPTEVAPAQAGTTHALPEGRFTVVTDEGHKTIRIRTQDEDSDFMPGKQVLSFLSGPNNGRDYTSFGNVADNGEVKVWAKHINNQSLRLAVRVILGDPSAARMAYAVESGSCSRCGRDLTVPASLNMGLGPECAKKGL